MTFYERVRPTIVHANDLEVLCDALSAMEGAIQDLSRLDADAGEPLSDVLSMIASDAQERLVFCAVRVIRFVEHPLLLPSLPKAKSIPV